MFFGGSGWGITQLVARTDNDIPSAAIPVLQARATILLLPDQTGSGQWRDWLRMKTVITQQSASASEAQDGLQQSYFYATYTLFGIQLSSGKLWCWSLPAGFAEPSHQAPNGLLIRRSGVLQSGVWCDTLIQ